MDNNRKRNNNRSVNNNGSNKRGRDLINKRTKLYDFNNIKNIDDIAALPKKFKNNKIKTKTYYTYIGLNKCKFSFEYNTPSILIHSYILNIINSTWYFHENSSIFLKKRSSSGYMGGCKINNSKALVRKGNTTISTYGNQNINEANLLKDDDDYNKNFYLLMHMIHTICIYNKMYKTPKKFKILNFNLVSNECVLFVDDNSMVLFNEPLIRKYLETSSKINVKLDDQLSNNQYIKKLDTLNYRYNLLNRASANVLLKLLCIADHAATHLIEQNKIDKTDFIFHENFGTIGFTLHSLIRINQLKKNKLLSSIFDRDSSSSCFTTLYPSTSSGSDQNQRNQIESIFNTKDLALF